MGGCTVMFVKGVLPLLVSVIDCAAPLVTPFWLEKLTFEGLALSGAGATDESALL